MMTATRLILLLITLLALITPGAWANDGDRKAEALAAFQRGIAQVDKKEWSAALEAFARSYALYPTRSALKNASGCLRELNRFDEALDADEELLRVFGRDLDPADRRALDAEIARLARYVGTLVVDCEPAGATVTVDGRDRGPTPLAGPLRVSVGTHTLRIAKEGYAPFEERVLVASGETLPVRARLGLVAQIGRLRVREASSGAYVVRVDSAVVGTTPWEGSLSAGQHTVSLRGKSDVGAPARAVTVEVGKKTDLVLKAAALPGELRVEPTPVDARVRIDGVDVARGTWAGSLPSGEHAVEVVADWYEPSRASVPVSAEAPVAVRPTLERVRRVYGEIYAGATLFPAYQVRGTDGCSGGCIGNLIGARGGYLLWPRVGMEIFFVPQMYVTRKSGYCTSDGTCYTADVYLSFGGFSIKYDALTPRMPLTLRMSAGLAYERPNASGAANIPTVYSPILGPEVRFGYRVGRTILIDAGLSLLVFAVPKSAVTQTDANATAPPTFAGGVGFTVPLTLGLHFDL
jgi:hypothetical protein